MTVQQYCLRWNNHQPNFISVFSSLLSSQSLVDVTLAAEGKHLQAHKVVLSACSSYFQSLFTVNPCKHPIVILKDVKFTDLKVMVDFMYHGEVNVSQEQLPCILKTAEMLKIKGLTEIPVDQSTTTTTTTTTRCQSRTDKPETVTHSDEHWNVDDSNRPISPSSPSSKRKRLKKNVICSTSTATESSEGPSSDILLSSMDNVFGGAMKVEQERYPTVMKSEPNTYQTENVITTMPQKCNGVPVPSIQAGPSHELNESEPSHHISLQVTPHDVVNTSLECSQINMSRTTTTAPQTTTGIQWNVLDQSGYAHFSSATSAIMSNSAGSQFLHSNNNTIIPTSTENNNPLTTISSPDLVPNDPYLHQVHKRKRNINPQGEQNFMRALDAVRYGGIGFCKAARMYGVNNRTLWLEYKKRGYPNFRLSIKNKHLKQIEEKQRTESGSQEHIERNNIEITPPKTLACTISHPIALISGNIFDGKHIELKHVMARDKFFDVSENPAETLNFPTLNLEHI